MMYSGIDLHSDDAYAAVQFRIEADRLIEAPQKSRHPVDS
jgi:hypothetical protein